jgi:flagellar biosynthesis/type III secretory pathway ATPase
LVEGDEENDPIAEEVRSLLDGHLQLSAAQARAHQFPAIDVVTSLSRLMPMITSSTQQAAAARIRAWIAKYRELELLLQMGEYRSGSDPEADAAIARMPAIRNFLTQSPQELSSLELARNGLMELAGTTHE